MYPSYYPQTFPSYTGAVPDQLQQYKNPYQMPMQAPIQPQMQSTAINQDERIWVASEAAAEAYIVAPNGFVRLWDSNNPVFYERRCDPSGKPYPMTIYDYKIRGTTPQPSQQMATSAPDYESRIKALEERLAALENSNVSNNKEAKI